MPFYTITPQFRSFPQNELGQEERKREGWKALLNSFVRRKGHRNVGFKVKGQLAQCNTHIASQRPKDFLLAYTTRFSSTIRCLFSLPFFLVTSRFSLW